MTDTSLMLMTGGDFQCEQTNCMGHKAGSYRTLEHKKPRNSHNEQFSFNLKGKTFSFWIKDTGKHSNQTWEVCSVVAVITKMHPAFNHTISLCKCNKVTGSLWECFGYCVTTVSVDWWFSLTDFGHTQCWHVLSCFLCRPAFVFLLHLFWLPAPPWLVPPLSR